MIRLRKDIPEDEVDDFILKNMETYRTIIKTPVKFGLERLDTLTESSPSSMTSLDGEGTPKSSRSLNDSFVAKAPMRSRSFRGSMSTSSNTDGYVAV
mmetsp:Transcript_35338/g.31797  ORF Transcript_35338/g.31797 Transcript_35338/m.31797 type:complete len:97 (+) Transcript_35338:2137-2427(+)